MLYLCGVILINMVSDKEYEDNDDSKRDDFVHLANYLHSADVKKSMVKMLTSNVSGDERNYIGIPSEYYMQFKSSREALFLAKLKYCDLYLYLYLCDNYASYNAFFLNGLFWKLIFEDMKKLDVIFEKQSITNSINKLRKNHFIFRIARATYTINSIFAYKGELDARHGKIKKDVEDHLMYKNSIK